MNKNYNSETTPQSFPGLTRFKQPGEELKTPSFEIMQVLTKNVALAHAGEYKYGEEVRYTGMLVLLIGDENTFFYDDQIIEVPTNKIALHTGTYQYETKSEIQKTVPVIEIFDRE